MQANNKATQTDKGSQKPPPAPSHTCAHASTHMHRLAHNTSIRNPEGQTACWECNGIRLSAYSKRLTSDECSAGQTICRDLSALACVPYHPHHQPPLPICLSTEMENCWDARQKLPLPHEGHNDYTLAGACHTKARACAGRQVPHGNFKTRHPVDSRYMPRAYALLQIQ